MIPLKKGYLSEMKNKKLLLNVDIAIEERARRMAEEIIGKYWSMARDELDSKLQDLSDKMAKDISIQAKEVLRNLINKK